MAWWWLNMMNYWSWFEIPRCWLDTKQFKQNKAQQLPAISWWLLRPPGSAIRNGRTKLGPIAQNKQLRKWHVEGKKYIFCERFRGQYFASWSVVVLVSLKCVLRFESSFNEFAQAFKHDSSTKKKIEFSRCVDAFSSHKIPWAPIKSH